MQTVTADFLESLTSGHDMVATLTYRNPISNATTLLNMSAGNGNQVALDVTAFIRRTLTFAAPNLESVYQAMSDPGGEITVLAGSRYGNTTELVPAGVYRVDVAEATYVSPAQELQLTCPDRSVVVQRARMGADRASVASNTVWQEIQRLVEGAFTSTYAVFPGWAQLDMTATTVVGAQIYDDGQRDTAITNYCTANSLEFFFNAVGQAVLRPLPTAPIGSWVTAFGPGGTMADADRIRSLADTCNVIVLTTTATDIQLPAVEVANTNNPLVDPLSSLGPMGRQVLDYSGNFRTSAQMTAAGQTLLAKYAVRQQQLTVTTVDNAALDGWDQVTATYLQTDLGTTPSESRIVQSYTLPLTNLDQSSSPMSITMQQVIPSTAPVLA